jgi:thiol:disulfide interchange protein
MARFQILLAVPMGLTAIGLGWLLWRQTGETGLMIGAAAALVLIGGLIQVGRRQSGGQSSLPLAAALSLASLTLITLAPLSTAAVRSAAKGDLAFSATKLAELRAQGRPVFLYFTADWCLTCKVNEQAAINREDVKAAFDKAGIVIMVGDWTNADPAIGRFLDAQGRSGVPLYLYYGAGAEPKELPQILTPAMLIALADRPTQ